jgi:hypothetical protein
VDRLRGPNQQPAALRKRAPAEQTYHPSPAGIGHFDLLAKAGVFARVVDTKHVAGIVQSDPRSLSAGCAALAALNQDEQHDDEQNSGNDANNADVHRLSLLFFLTLLSERS